MSATIPNNNADEKSTYAVGSKVEDFKLKDTNGNWVTLEKYKNEKGAVVIFTCNTCPYSKLYEGRIEAIHQKYANSGFPVLAINPNNGDAVPGDSYENMIVRAKEKNFTFTYAHDNSQEVAHKFGATRTPHVYLLEKKTDGFYVAYIGAIDNNAKSEDEVSQTYLANAIDDLLDGKSVENNSTKAIGCTIKWLHDCGLDH